MSGWSTIAALAEDLTDPLYKIPIRYATEEPYCSARRTLIAA
jgi:hypothetical protein